jgi:ABC-2 type transport system ATP-binding protein
MQIVTENLTKKFDDFLAVDQVNLQVPQGELLVLLGPNGAGKTTTVRMLTSLLRPTSGSAKIAGYDVVTHAAQVRSMVGVLTEHHGLYGRMNAKEYLTFFGELYGLSKQDSQKRFVPLLEKFGLINQINKRLGEYSKGMRQKLSLVRALINDPPVLLLDEPTSAMDPESSRMVRNAIQTLKQNDRTIILCTHNLNEADELADQVAIIQNGKIILNDYLETVKSTLLGFPVFEATFAENPPPFSLDFPSGVKVINHTGTQVTFEVENPAVSNPMLIQHLSQDYRLISFQQKARKLETAYLEAVNHHVGELNEKLL